MYDVFILGLTIVGISSVVVFSYKIFHSRVYPVGIVRRMPVAPECVDESSWSIKEIARDLHVSEHDIEGHRQRVRWNVNAKRYTKQRLSPQSGKGRYKVIFLWGQQPFDEREGSALEVEIVEHGEALKLHSRQFEEFEKRIRRLEVESVQKVQEDAEEKPPQVVH